MKNKLRRINETLLDLIIGILLFGVIAAILGMIITGDGLWYLSGNVAGVIIAIGICFHMLASIDDVLHMDPKSANQYMIKRAIIRFLIMAVAAIVAIKVHFSCFLGMVTALLGIKFAALLQPFIHNHITIKILK